MPNNPKLNIALAFSGGGYRAAGFNLGVLTYLDRIKIDNTSLLQHVSILSTVSGGTLTGARYAIGIKKGESLQEIYKSIYSFMNDIDLISLGLERLISDKGWNEQRIKNLINAFADVYDEFIFRGEKFGRLQSQENPTHLRHVSFNATDFAYALQFRFQWSDKTYRALQDETERGIIGNYYFRIPEKAAGEIRMGDIMAASSCFPGGFEPINFPTDFILPENIRNELQNSSEKYPVGLMDGGIVDNQGIEPILLAEERMNQKLKSSDSEKSKVEHVLDLIIVSDVASPFMDKYKASEQKKNNWWRRLTPSIISSVIITIFLLSVFFLFHGINHVKDIYIVIFMFMISICLIAFYIYSQVFKLLKCFHIPSQFLKPLKKLFRLRLSVYENMLTNRKNSMLAMANDVFLKHIRRLNYKEVFGDPSWHNRRIMNAIYELSSEKGRFNIALENDEITSELIPGQKIQNVADDAVSMPTTLWFTQEELVTKNMLDKLIACGQFTICWNLLEYINKQKKDNSNTNDRHTLLRKCETQLISDWNEFNKDPLWLINKYYK